MQANEIDCSKAVEKQSDEPDVYRFLLKKKEKKLHATVMTLPCVYLDKTLVLYDSGDYQVFLVTELRSWEEKKQVQNDYGFLYS